jgi:hypothetical protein
MGPSNVEDEIRKLGGGISEIYFNAKYELVAMQDSRSERFSKAAGIVRAFWKRARSSQRGASVGTTSEN